MSTLERLVDEFPDVKWDWDKLSSNPNIGWKFIKSHSNKVSWYHVLSNRNLTLEKIGHMLEIENLQTSLEKKCTVYGFKLDSYFTALYAISKNKNSIPTLIDYLFFQNKYNNGTLTISTGILCADLFRSNMKLLCKKISRHKLITWKHIELFPTFPWDWRSVSMNPNVTWDVICNNPNANWDWTHVSKNPNITLEIVLNDSYLHRFGLFASWNLLELSVHPNMTWEMINTTNLSWDSYYVSRNPNITWEIVLSNPEYHWNLYNLLSHIDIDYEILISKDFRVSLGKYSKTNANLENIYFLHSEKPLVTHDLIWCKILKNPGIYIPTSMLSTITKDGNFSYYYSNPNITYEFILANIENTCWVKLSENKFQYIKRVKDKKIVHWMRIVPQIFSID